MYTLENKAVRNHCLKLAYIYAVITLFCAVFGAIYEHFSHGVYSYHMIYAFAFPLALGVLPHLTFCVFSGICPPTRWAENLHNAGIATLTVGCIVNGVFAIYGTTSSLTCIYYIVGGFLILAGIVVYMTECIKN